MPGDYDAAEVQHSQHIQSTEQSSAPAHSVPSMDRGRSYSKDGVDDTRGFTPPPLVRSDLAEGHPGFTATRPTSKKVGNWQKVKDCFNSLHWPKVQVSIPNPFTKSKGPKEGANKHQENESSVKQSPQTPKHEATLKSSKFYDSQNEPTEVPPAPSRDDAEIPHSPAQHEAPAAPPFEAEVPKEATHEDNNTLDKYDVNSNPELVKLGTSSSALYKSGLGKKGFENLDVIKGEKELNAKLQAQLDRTKEPAKEPVTPQEIADLKKLMEASPSNEKKLVKQALKAKTGKAGLLWKTGPGRKAMELACKDSPAQREALVRLKEYDDLIARGAPLKEVISKYNEIVGIHLNPYEGAGFIDVEGDYSKIDMARLPQTELDAPINTSSSLGGALLTRLDPAKKEFFEQIDDKGFSSQLLQALK